MRSRIAIAALLAQASAAPTESHSSNLDTRAAVTPKLKSATYVANLTDPTLDRDSCGSVRIGSRVFWTCRDTEAYSNGQDNFPVVVSTASWTDQLSAGGPAIKTSGGTVGVASSGKNPILQMYGNNGSPLKEFFPLASDECSSNHGQCGDGTRWAPWPDSPPLITKSSSVQWTGYNWIARSHLSGLNLLNPNPPYTLYKTTYTSQSNKNTLPVSTIVNENFWQAGQVGFGDYGNFVANGYAYLYGLNSQKQTLLARVPVGSVETQSAYQYYNYTTGAYTSTAPGINDTTCVIPNAGAGGQGTFYYSTYYKSYIWLGQASMDPVADFFISTAPAPEGPWVPTYLLWSGPNSNGFIGAYSLQANPALLPSSNAAENAIYVTYTQPWANSQYVTPLFYLQFQ